jgi:hypothetical protein
MFYLKILPNMRMNSLRSSSLRYKGSEKTGLAAEAGAEEVLGTTLTTKINNQLS